MGSFAAVVLAAGASRRFGADNKLLVPIRGAPLVRGVAQAAVESGASEVLIVTGYDRPRIEEALRRLEVRFVDNPQWEAGMGTSVSAGIAALGHEVEAALIIPGDMPRITASVLAALVRAFRAAPGEPIVYAAAPDGEQRNPVLWPRRLFPQLMALAGHHGAKPILQRQIANSLAVPLPVETFVDIDTAADLEN